MRAILVVFWVVLIVGKFPACAAQEVTDSSLFYVANTEPPDAYLSLRTEPASSRGQRIMTMPNGTLLEVLKRQPDGWWYVRVVPTGQTGWALSGTGDRRWIECCKTVSGRSLLIASTENQASIKPSFNCATAKSAAARLICSDPELSNADAKLGKSFQGVLQKLDGDRKKEEIEEEVKWIRERNTRCQLDDKVTVPVEELRSSKSCMLQAIISRTAGFDGSSHDDGRGGVPITTSGTPPPNAEVTQEVSAATAVLPLTGAVALPIAANAANKQKGEIPMNNPFDDGIMVGIFTLLAHAALLFAAFGMFYLLLRVIFRFSIHEHEKIMRSLAAACGLLIYVGELHPVRLTPA